jgi:hypothetical protein
MSIERIEIRNQHLKFLKWTAGTFFKNKSISTTGLVLLFNNETVYELITNRLEIEIGDIMFSILSFCLFSFPVSLLELRKFSII